MMADGTRPIGRTALRASRIGLGGAPLGNLFAAVAEDEAIETLEAAWNHGIRYFDTAPLYGRGISERRIGAFLRGKPRGEFLLSTKVGRLLVPSEGPVGDRAYVALPPYEIAYDYSADGARRSLEASLARLGLERVDIAYIHDIGADTHGPDQPRRYREALEGAYRALADLRAQGVVGAIGLGVNDWRVCIDLLRDADPDCFLLAGRYTLLEQEPLAGGLFEALAARGASLVAAGAFNSGILAAGDSPGATYNYRPAPPAIRARVAMLAAVAAEHGVPLAAAALAFPLAQPAVASLVVGARRGAEVAENAALLATPIPAAFWQDLVRRGLLDPRAPVPA